MLIQLDFLMWKEKERTSMIGYQFSREFIDHQWKKPFGFWHDNDFTNPLFSV